MKTCLFREAKYAMLESPFIFEAYTVIAKSQSLPSCRFNAFCGHHAVFSVQYPKHTAHFPYRLPGSKLLKQQRSCTSASDTCVIR